MWLVHFCTGHDSGCEVAVHSIRQLFSDSETEAILLVHTENVFNSLNRDVALPTSYNLVYLCVEFS